jgi:hypothetical protein
LDEAVAAELAATHPHGIAATRDKRAESQRSLGAEIQLLLRRTIANRLANCRYTEDRPST